MVGNTCVEHTVWSPKVMYGFSVFWDVVIHILTDQIHVPKIQKERHGPVFKEFLI